MLGAKNYTLSIDVWSAALVLAELLLSNPCLPGDTPLEQLSLITRLLGSPTPENLSALTAMGCPDLIKWRREGFTAGRADNVERKFGPTTTPETVNYIRGMLQWDPRARWTAAEALGHGKSREAERAERWWKESPRAVSRELLPTYPEVRNRDEKLKTASRSKEVGAGAGAGADVQGEGGYVFDFRDEGGVKRPANKRLRVK